MQGFRHNEQDLRASESKRAWGRPFQGRIPRLRTRAPKSKPLKSEIIENRGMFCCCRFRSEDLGTTLFFALEPKQP